MTTTPHEGPGFDRRLLLGAAGLAGVAALSRLAQAGPLTPPGGPVMSTGKTLTSLEPRIEINATNTPGDASNGAIISNTGSYYLSGNFFAGAGKTGIRVASGDVTIDLMGFEVIGASSAGIPAITFVPGANGVIIRNGIIRAWAGPGTAPLGVSSRIVLEGIHIYGAQTGLILGQHSLARSCLIEAATADGISVGLNSIVEDCIIRSAGGTGILTPQNNAIFRNCAVYGCTSAGINAGSGSLVENCLAAANLGAGIAAQDNCVMRNCVATSNGTGGLAGAGISITGARNRIDANTMTLNDRGLVVTGNPNILTRNMASTNNRNWDIAANNAGQYILAVTGGSVAGSSGGVPIGSTDPWVNFTL